MSSPRGGGGVRGSVPGPATQLDFAQAMTDFKIMFPDMDVDVIEAVLRSNSGAVDATIDQLLAMTADNEQQTHSSSGGVMDTPPPEYQNNLPSYQQAVSTELIHLNDLTDSLGASSLSNPCPPDLLSEVSALTGRSLAAASSTSSAPAGPPLCRVKGWQPPLLGRLPPDFLRLKPPASAYSPSSTISPQSGTTASSSYSASRTGHSYTHHPSDPHLYHQSSQLPATTSAAGTAPPSSSSISQEMLRRKMSENQTRLGSHTTTPEENQMLEDEKFAIMLQNEEFMAELRGNREFLSTLEDDDNDEGYDYGRPVEMGGGSSKKGGGGGSGGGSGMDDALFRERVKNMGKQSKQKFIKLAHMFSRQKGAQRLLGHAPAPSKDNLLLNAEPILDPRDSDSGESEDERHSTTKGRKYQLM